MTERTEPAAVADDAPAGRPTPSTARAYVDLFLVSFLILFFELACIRWFGSTVIFLTFFTNLVLMACFLGMSVGLLAASRRLDVVRATIPLTLVSLVAGYATFYAYHAYEKLEVAVGDARSPQQIFFGTEPKTGDPSAFIVPIEVLAGVFFVLIALMFVGLGQEMGRRFSAIPNRVWAYTVDVLGSLAGIAAFGVASYYRTPPPLWFGVAMLLCLWFVPRRSVWQFAGAALIVGGLLAADWSESRAINLTWSPYYKVQYNPRSRFIFVNNILHQGMVRYEDGGPAYAIPHLLNRDSGGKPFEDVMIVGAGSGNDVAAALASGARHVDAVEIDPVINETGRALHPNRPYQDERVRIHLDDGRSFTRKTDRKYDLVEYALVDSLVLHSGYSSLRLESYLFTEEAFRDVKAALKPGGVFAMYNFYRQGWVVGRLVEMAREVFGSEPLVVSLPYRDRIEPNDDEGQHITYLMVGNGPSEVVERVREKLAESPFWLHDRPGYNLRISGYLPGPPPMPGTRADEWRKIAPATVGVEGIGLTPTDDWPFLYLREPIIPALNLRGMALVGVLSLAILAAFAPVRTLRPDGRMFFLGAGFMLLETKGVVHMALLFGSTWVVNSIVFGAILVMILLGNLFVLAVRPRRLGPYYALLAAALAVNLLVPMATFLALPGAAKVVASCAVVFVPVFFAAVIFAASFRDAARPDVALGSNVGGVILGGLSEYLSLMVGFQGLIGLAIGYYALSAILRPRA